MTVEGQRIWHGGDLGEAQELFPDAPRPWIDLSTGINPLPYPLPPVAPEAFARLPAPAEVTELEAVAAAAYGAHDPRTVVAAPGTQALIELLPRLRRPGRVSVVGPTYAEHAQAWRKAGHAVADAASLETAPDSDVTVVVNPNNPDGRRWPVAALREAADRLAQQDGWLVVDEAFSDLEEDVESLAPDLPVNAVVLRSFGKTYGLAGIRLGFAISVPRLAQLVRGALGPWAVSGPAIAIGKAALADSGWRAAAATARTADAQRLDELLAGIADRIVGGTRLFRLYELSGAPALFQYLGQSGIWVRRFRDDPSWLRFGLPPSPSAWARLEAALLSFDPALPSHADGRYDGSARLPDMQVARPAGGGRQLRAAERRGRPRHRGGSGLEAGTIQWSLMRTSP